MPCACASTLSQPAEWNGFKLRYRYRETVYHIVVTPMPAGKGETWVTVDGVARDDAAIPLVDDRQVHTVEVRVSGRRD